MCQARLAPIANRHQKEIGVAAHLSKCSKVSKQNCNASANSRALITKYGDRPRFVRVLKPRYGGMKAVNLTLYKVASQFRELHELQRATNHTLQRVERNSDIGRAKATDLNVAYTCATCLQI